MIPLTYIEYSEIVPANPYGYTITFKPISYWQLLELPFLQALDYLAKLYLYKRGKLTHLKLKPISSFRQVDIDPDQLVQATWNHIHQVEKYTRKKVTHLYLGRDYARLLSNELHRDYPALTFNIPFDYRARLAGSWFYPIEYMFSNLEVHFLPYWEGILAASQE